MMLDRRLNAAAQFVPCGARLADIGSDHAYLPIALCLDNRIECALASDINEGPVAAAKTNIAANGLDDKIRAIKADGLGGARDFAPDCITVLGMGGELIVSILSAAEWIRRSGITLILQPMTHPEVLARYLAENGFYIKDEVVVCDEGRMDRLYRIISAEFDGVRREISEAEAYVGACNLARGDDNTKAYIRKLTMALKKRIDGRSSVGLEHGAEDELLSQLESYL